MEQVLYPLPDGWEWQTFNNVCNNITDGAHASPKTVENGLPYVTVRDIDHKGYIDTINCKRISEEDFLFLKKGNCLPPVDSVLLSKDGTVGKVAHVTSDYNEFVVLSSLAIIVPEKKLLLPEYLKYFLLSPEFQDYAIGSKTGAAIKRIVLRMIKNFNIPIPPLEKQKRIVEKLDALLSRIDTAIEHLQESITLADALSKNGLAEIFETLKSGCEVVPLSSVVKINSGIALPNIFKNGFSDGEIPFYKVAQMNNHHENMIEPEITFNEIIAKEHKIKLFPKGSTLIPKRGGAILTNKKRILLEDASYDSNIMGLKADESKISDDYLFAFMRTIDLANFVDASTIPQVNNKHIDQMQIPLASMEVQIDVVNRVKLLVKKIETMDSEIKSQLNELLALKNSILDSAFKGEL